MSCRGESFPLLSKGVAAFSSLARNFHRVFAEYPDCVQSVEGCRQKSVKIASAVLERQRGHPKFAKGNDVRHHEGSAKSIGEGDVPEREQETVLLMSCEA